MSNENKPSDESWDTEPITFEEIQSELEGNETNPSRSGDAAGEPGSEITRLKEELQEAEKKALRYQADMDNFRRRARREADEQVRYAALPLLTDLLEAFDNLHRAVESANEDAHNASLLAGVRMVASQIQNILTQHGCEPIESVGQKFDPKLHQAVQTLPSDEQPADHVLQDLRAGFRLHERVIRPAQVIVSTGNNAS
jgi:molecular chaperone GrpE